MRSKLSNPLRPARAAACMLALAAGAAGCRTAPSPGEAMQSELRADGPLPALRDRLMTFGQFVGVWDLDVRFFDEAGKLVFHGPGRWRFAWVLDGRAIQDVLTYAQIDDPSKTAPGERRIGSSMRHYDPRADQWRVVWVGAASNTFVTLAGNREGDRIVLRGQLDARTLGRWSFNEIEHGRFHWLGEKSTDSGATWRVEQEMYASRVL